MALVGRCVTNERTDESGIVILNVPIIAIRNSLNTGDTPFFFPAIEEPLMTASWAELFERGAAYDVDLEAIRRAADGLPENTEEDDG